MHDWLQALRQQLQQSASRAVLLLAGEPEWQQQFVQCCQSGLDTEFTLFVSSRDSRAVSPRRAQVELGREYQLLVFDTQPVFDANALGALAGTVRGGGMIVLLLEDPGTGEARGTRMLQRLLNLSLACDGIYRLQPHTSLPPIPQFPPEAGDPLHDDVFRTDDQARAVQRVSDTLASGEGHLLLVADRGRGKSSALGIVAAHLLQAGHTDVVMTAPRLGISEPAFARASRLCDAAEHTRGRLQLEHGVFRFMAPDRLLQERPPADVLLVDEAAAIPLFMTRALLQHYPRVVLATTVHGYEGTGRGLVMKLRQSLGDFPHWQEINLDSPVRWSRQDPVEPWLNRVLCLDAEPAPLASKREWQYSDCRLRIVSPDELLQDESLLSSVFALLVNAHYRTRPSDLAQLLDDDSVRLYLLQHRQQVIGVLLLAYEGGLDGDLSEAIYRGERRPAGHMLAQTLTFHAGMKTAACLHYARVMRIAIRPELQHRGFGSAMLQQVVAQESARVDAVGVSFSADKPLLDFWLRNDFTMLRLGFSRDHVTGRHGAVLLRPTSDRGRSLCAVLEQKFLRYLPAWLAGPFADVDEDLRSYLFSIAQPVDGMLTEDDLQEVYSFAHFYRGYEACMWPMRKWLLACQDRLGQLQPGELAILQAKVLDGREWPEVIRQLSLSGMAEAVSRLRQATRHLLEVCDSL